MVYYMKLNQEPFRKIAEGSKTVELRLFDVKRRGLDIGDDIIFYNLSDESEKLAVRVKALYRYGSFEELFSEISPERCGNPKGMSIKEAAEGMKKYYTEEQIQLYGVLGIKIEVINLEEALKRKEEIYMAQLERYFPDGMK